MNPDQENQDKSTSSDDSGAQKDYQQSASKFIENTSLDKMLEMAEIARRKKLSEPPKWVIPDEI
ncbi:MAG: hypothetical protein AAFQ80_04875 [Cyanobacteria bacterium J06621_8]